MEDSNRTAAGGSKSEESTAELVVLIVMLSIFSVVGCIGNGMVIFVFQKVRVKSTAQIFIIALAIIDFFNCSVIIPFSMAMEIQSFKTRHDAVCKIYQFLLTSKIPLSAFIMVAIAFDRYFCICHPLTTINTPRRAKIIVLALSLLSLSLGILFSLNYGVYQYISSVDLAAIRESMRNNVTMLNMKEDGYVEKLMKSGNYTNMELYNIGECHTTSQNDEIRIKKFLHFSVYPLCLILVSVVYFLIFRFMRFRRLRKLEMRLEACSKANGQCSPVEEILLNEKENAAQSRIHDKNDKNDNDANGLYESVLSTKTESPGGALTTKLVSGKPQSVFRETDHARDDESPVHELLPAHLTNYSPSPTAISYLTMPDTAENTSNYGGHSPYSSRYSEPPSHKKETDSAFLYNASEAEDSHATTLLHNGAMPYPSNTPADRSQNTLVLTTANHEKKYHWHKSRDSVKGRKGQKKCKRKEPRSSANSAERLREETRNANFKTALMLFTVTLVFVVTFTPALLIMMQVVPHQKIVFYLYFAYNVANPFIYAFMNRIFKSYLRKQFACKNGV